MLQALKDEFEMEVKSTRGLLHMVPEKDLGYKPSPTSWSMGELAQHIAKIYSWYVGTFSMDVYDTSKSEVEQGSPSDLKATLDLFESNVEKAREALNSIDEENLKDQWTMTNGDKTVLGPLPRGAVARKFVFNHIYHHRGEMIIYLLETGNKVPNIYGVIYEDEKKEA